MKEVGLQDLVDCIVENHPYAWTWQAEELNAWIGWYAKNGLIIANTVEGKKIDGLVMFRLVMKPKDGCGNNLNYDPEGSVVFLDFTYGPSAEIRRGLIVSVIQRVGRRETVAWERRGVLRVYSGKRFVMHNLKEGSKV
jgi:hypothetical protein